MATTSVTIRMDSSDKAKAEKLFGELGLNMTTAFNMFIKQAIRSDGIPFDVTLRGNYDDDDDDDAYFYNPTNLAHLYHSIAQVSAGKVSEHELIEVDDDDQKLD